MHFTKAIFLKALLVAFCSNAPNQFLDAGNHFNPSRLLGNMDSQNNGNIWNEEGRKIVLVPLVGSPCLANFTFSPWRSDGDNLGVSFKNNRIFALNYIHVICRTFSLNFHQLRGKQISEFISINDESVAPKSEDGSESANEASQDATRQGGDCGYERIILLHIVAILGGAVGGAIGVFLVFFTMPWWDRNNNAYTDK